MWKTIWQNFKTTVLGGVAGGTLITKGIAEKDNGSLITGIAVFLLGLFAKDATSAAK